MADAPKAGQTNNTTLIIGGVVILALVLIVGWWAFNRNTDDADIGPETLEEEPAIPLTETATPLGTNSPSPSPVGTNSPSPSPSPVTGQLKSFAVAAENYAFTPKEIRVKEGDMVRITLANNSTMPHDWNLDEFDAATRVITNEQIGMAEFTASKAGTYEYYCSVGTHRQMGMVGKLIVE